jgi:predicted ATPase/DNA-binding SARP family transcriptional activator
MMVELTLLSRVAYRDQEIAGRRLQGLLALLASDLRRGCGTARLIDGLWPHEQPENPSKALQILVSRARAQLGADVIATTPTGYRLTLREDQVDASAVLLGASASARHARAGDQEAALAQAEAGLALYEQAERGDAGRDDPLSELRAERATTYQSLLRARALALSRLGRHAEAVAPLTDLFGARPRDEEVLLELLRCEAATVGPSAALDRYETHRRALRDELGSSPGPALQAEHQQLLRGAAPAIRHGIPHDPNPLVGRASDITAVTELLRASRVTSVVGAGGLGKTRLAHAVSRQAEQRIVRVVPLAGVTTDDDVADEVASVLGMEETWRMPVTQVATPQGVLAGIVDALGPALLVLDNCEHVIRGAAELVRALVSMSPDLRVLTTSRTPLGLSSEAVYLLPELSLPATVELFRQRARAARPGIDLPADAVEEVCQHLDGLPLAVELAAARVRVMSLAEISRHLDDRFALLRGGARDAPPRHHALHAVVDWSWNLLDPAGQAAMRALSVFPGGFTAEAAGHLLGDDDVLHVLEQLVDQSLLEVIDTPTGTRFRMLETVREFSVAHRQAAGETDRVTSGLLTWAHDFGVAHHASILGEDPFTSARRIRAEHDNLVQALRDALTRDDGAATAAITALLAGLWTMEQNHSRMATLIDQTAWALLHVRAEPDTAEVIRTAATLSAWSALMIEHRHVARLLVTLRRLPPAPPDSPIRALAIVLEAAAHVRAPDDPALGALCDSDEPLLAGIANGFASYLWESDRDPDNALKAAERMLEALERHDSPWRMNAHARIAELSLQLERGDQARQHLRAALEIMEEAGPWPDVMSLRLGMVLANLQVGAVDEAAHWLEQVAVDPPDEWYDVTFYVGVHAEILLAQGDTEAGLHKWRRAADQARNSDGPVSRVAPPGLDPWILEVHAVAVIAHAQHGRLDLVEELAAELPPKLSAMLTRHATPPSLTEFPVCGALLLALAMVDLDRAARSGDDRGTMPAVRLIALAERFQFVRLIHPMMSSKRARQAAERADGPAYHDAVSSYAGLDGEELRAAALHVLRERVDPLSADGGRG